MDIFDFLKFSIDEEHKAINSLLDKMSVSDLSHSIGDDQTIGSRLKHMTSAEFKMAQYLYQIDNEPEFNLDKISIESLKKAFEQSKERNLLTICNLQVEDLEKVWKSKISGNEYSYKFLLYHFIEHLSTHRGQVSMAYRLSQK